MRIDARVIFSVLSFMSTKNHKRQHLLAKEVDKEARKTPLQEIGRWREKAN